MNSKPLISVIMPSYNARRYIEQSVNSVFSQQGVNTELIVVDDGSTDGTRAILERIESDSMQDIHIFHQQNRGPYPARNYALKHAKGDLIAFLDADDYWDESCLSKLQNAIISQDADLAYCGWQNIGSGAPGGQEHIPRQITDKDAASIFLKACPWPIHAALVRRHVMSAVGGFSERYRTSMDYDLWLRILAVTRNLALVPEVLAYYRWHDSGQISSVKWKQIINAWQVRRDFISNNPELLRHIPPQELRRTVDAVLLEGGYSAYWKQDLESAWHLFRKSVSRGRVTFSDLKYILPALLPFTLYAAVINGIRQAKNH